MTKPKTPKPTMRDKFLEANKESPVVSGKVNMGDDGKPSGGVTYRLKNGKRFVLTGEDAIGLPMPVWDLPPDAPAMKALARRTKATAK